VLSPNTIDLTDFEWRVIKPLLPNKRDVIGVQIWPLLEWAHQKDFEWIDQFE
jgi:hypothetical protein